MVAATATNVVVFDAVPEGTLVASVGAPKFTQDSAATVEIKRVGKIDTVTVKYESLPINHAVIIDIKVFVTAGAGTVLTNTATVSATTQDLNTSNNSATQKTTVAKK